MFQAESQRESLKPSLVYQHLTHSQPGDRCSVHVDGSRDDNGLLSLYKAAEGRASSHQDVWDSNSPTRKNLLQAGLKLRPCFVLTVTAGSGGGQ